jgi:UDP-2,4-diacetamido-2,4,6-trideoxy-beta-L-altropyranose hydrolase
VLFVCDAGPLIGGGHVMRCLTLARALQDRGARCVFLQTPAAAPILAAFSAGEVAGVPAAGGDAADLARAAEQRLADGWEGSPFAGAVIDHYGFDAPVDARLRAPSRPLLVLEDRAAQPRSADLLLDASFGRAPEDYASPSLKDAQLLLGPAYALVRPEFAAARAQAPLPRDVDRPVRRVLVSLGLTDVGGVTAEVLRLILTASPSMELIPVVGGAAPSLPELRRLAADHPRLRLRIDATDMAALMAEADVAVGAGGSSTWERACLGLPSLSLVLADNQEAQASGLAAAGATLAVDYRAEDFADRFTAAWNALVTDAPLRLRLSKGSAALCDGRGAERVAEAFSRTMAA